MGANRALHPCPEAGGTSTASGYAGGLERDYVSCAQRMFLADVAPQFPPLEHGPHLLPGIPQHWSVAQHTRCASRGCAAASRARGDAQRGNHRQPECENHRKRGLRGYDAGKKVLGRKRHIVVDTLGLIIGLVVHGANEQDRDGAKHVLARLNNRFPRLRLIWADGAYRGKLVSWVEQTYQWDLEIVKRNDDVKGFSVLPRRWVVERTFAWLGRYRRLSKDYEELTQSSETMITLAMINLMSRRLAR